MQDKPAAMTERTGGAKSDAHCRPGAVERNPDRLRLAAKICGAAAALCGMTGLAGWVTRMPLLTGGAGPHAPIAPDTAVAVLACGLVLFFSAKGFSSARGRRSAGVAAVVVSLYGLARFAEYSLAIALIPRSLPVPFVGRSVPYPGGMSPIAGTVFFLAGVALVMILRGKGRGSVRRGAAGMLGLAVLLTGFIGMIGYLFGTPLLYGARIIPLSALAVLAFCLLGAGLVAAGGPESLIMKPFTGPFVRARLLRTFLPLTALMILSQGLLHEIVSGFPALNSALWEALITVIFVLITGAVVVRASQSISRSEELATAERRRTEVALRESTRLFRNLARMAPVGIVRTTAAGECAYVNERWCEMSGMTAGQALGNGWLDAVHPDDREHVGRQWARCVRENMTFKMEYRLLSREGRVIWVLGQAIPETDAVGGSEGHVGTVTDITPSKQMEQKIIDLALTDQMTGLYNRRGFMMLTEQQLKAAFRQKQGMILFFADVDYLKRINDTLGHEEGDRAIMGTAAVLRETFRESDVIARTGGDEFAILAINTDGCAEGLLNRLRERIAVANRREGCRYQLSLSVGVAYYDPNHPCSLDALISSADTLMYAQKKGRQDGLLLVRGAISG